MITLEEFRQMERGTVFYIAAGGKANNLVAEKFWDVTQISVSVEPGSYEKEYRPFILTYGGGMCFINHLLLGACCYFTKEEAEQFMQQRANRKHQLTIETTEKQIARLQEQLAKMLTGSATVDYLYLDFSDRTDEPVGGLYGNLPDDEEIL